FCLESLPVQSPRSFEDYQQFEARPICHIAQVALDFPPVRCEVAAFGESLPAVAQITLDARSGMAPGGQIRRLQRAVEVQLAWTAVIVETVRDVRVLLDLAERDARADGVNRPRRDEIRLAGMDRNPAQQPLDSAAQGRCAQLFGADRLLEPER